jgi:hypothetical protein
MGSARDGSASTAAFAQEGGDRSDTSGCVADRFEHCIEWHARTVLPHAFYVQYVIRAVIDDVSMTGADAKLAGAIMKASSSISRTIVCAPDRGIELKRSRSRRLTKRRPTEAQFKKKVKNNPMQSRPQTPAHQFGRMRRPLA